MALTLLVGGARSGKSTLAVRAAGFHGRPVVFLATAEALDEEMAERIRLHRAERPPGWRTVEAPLHVADALRDIEPDATVILDCVTMWVANGVAAHGEAWVLDESAVIVQEATARGGATLVVSNEVGSGIVPADAATRRWRDLLGRVNSAFSGAADAAYLVVAGRAVELVPPRRLIGG